MQCIHPWRRWFVVPSTECQSSSVAETARLLLVKTREDTEDAASARRKQSAARVLYFARRPRKVHPCRHTVQDRGGPRANGEGNMETARGADWLLVSIPARGSATWSRGCPDSKWRQAKQRVYVLHCMYPYSVPVPGSGESF